MYPRYFQLNEFLSIVSVFKECYHIPFVPTGGWAFGCCPHGVIYSIKNLLRGEGARDYVDLERSLKVRPNITVVDMAHVVARNANRTVPGFYSPNEGRLCEAKEDVVNRALEGNNACAL